MPIDLTNPLFNDEDLARAHIEKLRWPDGVVCPHCDAPKELIAAVEHTGKRTKPVPEGKKHRPARKGLYFCNSCKAQFTVCVGTVLEKSHIPMHKWLAGFFLMCSSKKGISAHQLHRNLKLSYKSAWFMAHRIREAMRSGGLAPPRPMGGPGQIVEVDETFIGRKKGARTRGGYQHKQVALTLVSRTGEARSFQVDHASAQELEPIIRENIARETTVAYSQVERGEQAKRFLA
ncbi:MAG TPA: IS1595 family transposase [Hyphomicrobiaceae bacterium]|nr:IS1595 family transposase [Hyphomicrobiaceae bacterium]